MATPFLRRVALIPVAWRALNTSSKIKSVLGGVAIVWAGGLYVSSMNMHQIMMTLTCGCGVIPLKGGYELPQKRRTSATTL